MNLFGPYVKADHANKLISKLVEELLIFEFYNFLNVYDNLDIKTRNLAYDESCVIIGSRESVTNSSEFIKIITEKAVGLNFYYPFKLMNLTGFYFVFNNSAQTNTETIIKIIKALISVQRPRLRKKIHK